MPTPIGGISPPSPARPIVMKPVSSLISCSSVPGFGRFGLAASLLHGGVEGELRRREVGPADERERVLRPVLAVHAAVLPLDRERPLVADPVQRAEERLEVDVAVAG